MPEYAEAPEVKEIAENLIENEIEYNHLKRVSIKYMYCSPAPKSQGKICPGKTTKVSSKYHNITGYDFIIEISGMHFSNMEEKKRVALIEHELNHCNIDNEGNTSLVPHDFEGFNSVLQKHGYWANDLKLLGKTAQQLELPFDPEPEFEVVGK